MMGDGRDETQVGIEPTFEQRLHELLRASESGPAGQQVTNVPGRPEHEIMQQLGLV